MVSLRYLTVAVRIDYPSFGILEFTVRYKSDILIPRYRQAQILALASKSVFNILKRSLCAEQLFLRIPQRWAGLYQVHLLHG